MADTAGTAASTLARPLPSDFGMNARRLVPALAIAAVAAFPAAAPAQSDPQPKPERGKVDGVEGEARRARRESDGVECVDCGGSGFFLIDMAEAALRAFFVTSPHPGQGYHRYPYADTLDADPFVRGTVASGRRFGAFSASYFADDAEGGTLRAGQIALEGANGVVHAGVEYTLYREPTQTDVDWLHLARVSIGAVPRLGRVGFLQAGLAARAVSLDNGNTAVGPELELGVQTFPGRPWGVAVNARGALVSWSWGGSSGFADLTANGSYFVGRAEVIAGWRYTKVGRAAAFNGPTAGVRLWF